VPARWGQSPFTNITIDWTVPSDLKDQIPTRNTQHLFKNIESSELLELAQQRGANSLQEMTYKHFQNEMHLINKAYYEVMTQGDKTGQPFTFPIPTVNITEEFDWYGENTDVLFENTAKIGSSYFQNFIGSQYTKDENGNLIPNDEAYKPGHVRSMCCRLQLDLRELLKRGGGLFGSAEMTGSIGVVTINMARLGYLYAENKKALYERLDELMQLAYSTLEKKRVFVQEMYDRGLYPYTKRYLKGFNNHFSTIGINGINEMIRNFTSDKHSIASEFGAEFALEILDFMRAKMIAFQEQSGNLYNLEATPAEGTTYRFAKEDKKRYKDILQAGMGKNIYYTNSSQLPVDLTDDPFEALSLQDELQCKYTGGTVLHLYMKEKISSTQACRNLVKKVISNFKLPYITITPLFSVCEVHGYIQGEHEYCPKCDEELLQQLKKEEEENVS
jgi:ribonucleoside-triphosphate reductase